jgi:hypothetical protein
MSLIRRWLRRTDRALDIAPAEGGTRWWERNRQTVEVVGVWLEAMGVLAAAVVALSQYQANSTAERVKQTLAYRDRFQDERLYNARRSLEDAWNARSREVFAILNQPDGEARLASFLKTAVAEAHLDPAITNIVDFYDELQACTTSDLCDHDTAVRFFGKYAADLHGLLTPYFQAQRDELRDPQIASGVDYFSREYRRSGGKGGVLAAAKDSPARN